MRGRSATDVVGRANELAAIREAIAGASIVTLVGPPGIGKSTLARAAVADRDVAWGTCLAALAWRPFAAFADALGMRPPGDEPNVVASWLLEALAGRILVIEDLQFADPSTLRALEIAAPELAALFTLRINEPASSATLVRLRGMVGCQVNEVGPMTPRDAVALAMRLGASAAEATSIVAMSKGHPLWIMHALGALDSASLAQAVAGIVDRLDPPVRTVLAALGLLGRPAHRAMLGGGVGAAVEHGLVGVADDTVTLVHPMYGEVAAARTTPSDREALHLALGRRLSDPGEAARHLAAAGDRSAAAASARSAAAAATSSIERATHLSVVASCTDSDDDVIEAASAALDAGDAVAAMRWVSRVDATSDLFAAAAAVGARAARLAGDPAALEWAQRGLDSLGAIRGATWRRLSIESTLCGSDDLSAAEALVEQCVGTTDEAAARIAAATIAIASRHASWETYTLDAIGAAVRANDVGAELEGRWLHVGATAATGALDDAIECARRAGERATELGAAGWTRRFAIEGAWLIAVRDPIGESPAAIDTITALRLADTGSIEAARGLLRRAVPHDSRHAAVTSCVAWWAHDDALARESAQRALIAGYDPVVALLAGPTAAWTGAPCGASPQVQQESRAVERRTAMSPEATDLFLLARDGWADVSARGVARCAWAAADAAVTARDRRAQGLVCEAATVVETTGVAALHGRVASVARAAGVVSRRQRVGPAGSNGLSVTAREAEVLTHVAAGLSTRQIAQRLGVSVTTVSTHIRSSIVKLGSANRREAAASLAATLSTTA
ncbi:hypothetical protein BH20ACT4_BH20ACT4_07060 [soil metagenome]